MFYLGFILGVACTTFWILFFQHQDERRGDKPAERQRTRDTTP